MAVQASINSGGPEYAVCSCAGGAVSRGTMLALAVSHLTPVADTLRLVPSHGQKSLGSSMARREV